MLIKSITDEDFINYKKPSMVIAFPFCNLKCDRDCGRAVCQNSPLLSQPNIDISYKKIIERYLKNPITEAIVLQGMEPLDSMSDVVNFIMYLRIQYKCNDDIVIYTGYTKEEAKWFTDIIGYLKNIIIKYGRYIPDQTPHYDKVLGVYLASDNQYAEKIINDPIASE